MDDSEFDEASFQSTSSVSTPARSTKRSYKYPWLHEHSNIGQWKNSVREMECKGCEKKIITGHPVVLLNHLLQCSYAPADVKLKINIELSKGEPKRRRGETSESFSLRRTTKGQSRILLEEADKYDRGNRFTLIFRGHRRG